jgi:uracil-DNA glycosylase
MICASFEPTFEGFRQRARELLSAQTPPGRVFWSENDAAQRALFVESAGRESPAKKFNIPRRYYEMAKIVSHHRDEARWPLLYSVVWRMLHGEPNLLSIHTDEEVHRLEQMRQQIARDVHHMHAFVRFRRMHRDGEEWYLAWYRPDHHVLRLAAPFFEERFAAMKWAILTPEESVYWDGERLRYGNGVQRSEASNSDDLEDLWSTYYRTTFNPARTNLDLMRQEMPTRFWSQMPELNQLPGVLAEAPSRLATMQHQQTLSARPLVPTSGDLNVLREAARTCTGCSLHCSATQTVFGRGPSTAKVVLIGEQPGDVEDQRGLPFVGPAGEVLDRALADAGIPRDQVYMTNAVKHFKHTREGKRRLHETPRMSEIVACKPWLEAELAAIRPQAIVLLGATAAKALLGGTVRITRDAGKFQPTSYAPHTLISVHPSFVLRSRDEEQSRAIFNQLVAHLRTVRRFLDAGRIASTNSEAPEDTPERT